MEAEYDHLFKVLVIGDSAVGKTSVLLRYVDDAFSTEFQTTIGVDFKVNSFAIDGQRVKLQLWDTAGQDRFRHIVASYYRGAHGLILMYDVTSAASFDNIKKWNEEAENYLQATVPKMLIGNKADLDSHRQVTREQAQALAEAYNMEFVETSAKTALNVTTAFETMTRAILNQLPLLPQALTGSTRLPDTKTIANTGWCCSN